MIEETRVPSTRFLLIATATLLAVALLAAGIVIGLLLGGLGAAPRDDHAQAAAQRADEMPREPLTYTCSMHPQIRLPDPDVKCPICFMDLIPAGGASGAAEGMEPVLAMSEAAMRLAEIQVEPVRRMLPRAEVRMAGKIDYDETRQATISAYFPGRLDRLFIDYTGIPVRAGDHLASIYSPELLTAEAELLAGLETLEALGEGTSGATRQIARATVDASRQKLRLWGLTAEQVGKIEQSRSASDHMTIYSPIGGIVTSRHKMEGDYVRMGEPICSIADLSRLWVRLDAYESDLPWIRFGQEVQFTAEAHPGEIFHGRISFIDPHVSPATRTVKVRVNVDNAGGRLKPGMFVRAAVRPVIGGAGRVIAADLAGKWISPMHPEVIKDGPGVCDVCGMDLVPAEELGYVTQAADAPPPLVIPITAPLITGERAIVYVQLPDRERPTFEGRTIALGPRAGSHYIVREDVDDVDRLAEGELIVTHGNFKIDSALQLQARPSMMSPPRPPEVGSAPNSGDRRAGAINDVCPVMGGAVDPNTPTVMWRGYKIGFCCPGCDQGWNDKTEEEKDAFLTKFVPDWREKNESSATGKPVNDVCPVMGGVVDPDTPTAMWRGYEIGFCCPGCDGAWQDKTEEEKDAFLARYVNNPAAPAAKEDGDG